MLFSYYRETSLEQWISSTCLDHGIVDISSYDIDHIAEAFGVDLIHGTCPSFSDNEDRVIFLNKQLDQKSSRMIFLHELCHVLRHAGDQRQMSSLFKEAQEFEADQFVLYASVPFYLFAKLPVPEDRIQAVPYLADAFHIPYAIAEQRLDQIQRRILQGSLMAAAEESVRRGQAQAGHTGRSTAWSTETRRVLDQLDQQLSKSKKEKEAGGG